MIEMVAPQFIGTLGISSPDLQVWGEGARQRTLRPFTAFQGHPLSERFRGGDKGRGWLPASSSVFFFGVGGRDLTMFLYRL